MSTLILAKHQREILERRFPHYEYVILEVSCGADYWLRVETKDTKTIILIVSFMSSFIKVAWRLKDWKTILCVDYANPKFTDDTISDILREWEIAKGITHG